MLCTPPSPAPALEAAAAPAEVGSAQASGVKLKFIYQLSCDTNKGNLVRSTPPVTGPSLIVLADYHVSQVPRPSSHVTFDRLENMLREFQATDPKPPPDEYAAMYGIIDKTEVRFQDNVRIGC